MNELHGTYEIGKCPDCGRPIGDQYPYPWCSQCYKPLPNEILRKLPHLERKKEELLKQRELEEKRFDEARLLNKFYMATKIGLVSSSEIRNNPSKLENMKKKKNMNFFHKPIIINQKTILIIALCLILFSILFPPYIKEVPVNSRSTLIDSGWKWIFDLSDTHGYSKIRFDILLCEIFAIGIIAVILIIYKKK
jgi:hypothetical protein